MATFVGALVVTRLQRTRGEKMIVVDRPNIAVEWDETKRLMRVEFRGFIDGEEYRETLDRALQVVIAKKCTRILWDLRAMKVLTPDDQKWAETDWTPRLVRQSKVKRTVSVVPKSAVAQMSLKRVSEKTAIVMENEILSRTFDSIEDAEKWVMTNT